MTKELTFYHEWLTGDWNEHANAPATDEWWLAVETVPAGRHNVPHANFELFDRTVKYLTVPDLRRFAALLSQAADELETKK